MLAIIDTTGVEGFDSVSDGMFWLISSPMPLGILVILGRLRFTTMNINLLSSDVILQL